MYAFQTYSVHSRVFILGKLIVGVCQSVGSFNGPKQKDVNKLKDVFGREQNRLEF